MWVQIVRSAERARLTRADVATRWYRAPEVMLSNRRYTTASESCFGRTLLSLVNLR
jgi:hypothetical protein